MSNEEIKNECEQIFDTIKKSRERIEELQSICKHEHTFEGNYSWRVGCIDPATICSYCNKLIELHNGHNKVFVTKTN